MEELMDYFLLEAQVKATATLNGKNLRTGVLTGLSKDQFPSVLAEAIEQGLIKIDPKGTPRVTRKGHCMIRIY